MITNFKRIGSWFSHVIRENYASVFIAVGPKSIFRKNVKGYYERPRLKKPRLISGFLLNGATTLSSIWNDQSTKDDVENNISYLIKLAKLALETGDLERAERILELSLKLSEEHNLYTGIPFIYDILASLAISEGNIEKAELLIVEVIEKLTKLGFADNNHNIIDFRLRLARMYSSSGYNSLANLGFENCLDQQKTKILSGDLSDKTGLLYIHILFWYGVHKVRNELYQEARQLISNAYDYSSKIKGLSPKQEMVILYTLADVNAELGDYEVALSSLLNAIILGKGIGSVDLPVCYLKLGNIYEKLEMQEKAKHSYLEAKAQAEVLGYGDVVIEAVSALSKLNNFDVQFREIN